MARTAPILAKLSQPVPHAPVCRTRLFEWLDQRKGVPIVWVGAPAGSGKTTLVASYLQARKRRTFWYQVDADDQDPATLFHYLGALGAPLGSEQLPEFTPDYVPDLAGFSRRYFRDLFARFGGKSSLVLDNCQDADNDAFHRILREAVSEVPGGLQVIAISRGLPPPQLAREGINGRLVVLGWEDLRASDEEALALAKRAGVAEPGRVAALNRQCDGWMGGLAILLARRDSGEPDGAKMAFESRETLFAYFAEELLAHVPPETRTFLLHSALLPSMTAGMAESITGQPCAARILASLHRRQLFVQRTVDAGQISYQYHELFRQFLLQKLADETPSDALAELRNRAAVALYANGRASDAIRLFGQVSNWDEVEHLIRANADALIAAGRWQTLAGWFEGFPQARCDADPWLLFWSGSAQAPLDAPSAYRKIRKAHEAFVGQHDERGEFHALCQASILAYALGDSLRVYDDWFPRLELKLAKGAAEHSCETMVYAWTAYFIMLDIRTGRGALAEVGQNWLIETFLSDSLSREAALAAGDTLIHRCIWPARTDLEMVIMPRVLALADQEDSPPAWRYQVTKDLGYWYFYNAEYGKALSYFDRAILQSSTFALHAQRRYAMCWRVMTLCALGDASTAGATMDELRAEHGFDDFFLNGAVDWAESVLMAARGHRDAACERAVAAMERAREHGFTILEINVGVFAAVFAAHAGRNDAASALVKRIRSLTRGSVWCFADCLLCAVEVQLHLRCGHKDAALERLASMLSLAQNARLAAMLSWAKPWLGRHLAWALDAGIGVSTARALIRRFGVVASDDAPTSWPWRVRVFVLGHLEVRVDGETLTFGRKAPRKVLSLLSHIIALGGQAVPVAELVDVLWPDSDGDAAHEAFKNAILRLRKLLDCADAVRVGGGAVTLSPEVCWVDALAFERASEQAAALDAPLVDRAIALYRGRFAPTESSSTVALARERLRRKFTGLVTAEGRRRESRQAFESAAELYRACLERDPAVEEFYQGLLRCHIALGQAAQGMTIFSQLQEVLSATPGAHPSPQSLALLREVRSLSA